MRERIIKPGMRYYAGGTISKIAGHDGVTDIPMMAAEYAPEPKRATKKVYMGGTVTSTVEVDQDFDWSDDMDRELFKK